MPTSASRRVWEGKAGNYSAKAVGLAIPLLPGESRFEAEVKQLLS